MPILSKNKIIFSLIFLAVLAGGLFFAQNVLTQTTGPLTVADTGITQAGQDLGLPATDLRLVIARIIRIALGFLGVVALGLILYGGFIWMTAGGNEENIAKAKKILVNAAIGLAIILSAYAIVSFVISNLLSATGGGTGTNEGGAGGGPGGFSKVLYIMSMPGDDFGCGIRNAHPVIVFNKNVNLDSIRANLRLQKKDGGAAASGAWNFAGANRQNAVVFDPVGDCGVTPAQNDCLDAGTTYQIVFDAANIQSQDVPPLSLKCTIGNYKKQCQNNPSMEFTTGASVDTEPPTITILNPADSQEFPQGQVIPVEVSFTDNFGLQNVSLQVDGADVDSQNISGCKKSGTATISWPSGNAATGTHALTAIAADNANLTANDTRNIILRPGHCYNNVLDHGETLAGPPACGGECGACGGGSCSQNSDCASGFCENGICVDRMKIIGISPTKGAASTTYVSIAGQFFGDDGGGVYFKNAAGEWTLARIANCGAGIDNWTPSQLVVKVPADAVTGPILVVTASTTVNGAERKWEDKTDDAWGPNLGFFTVNNDVIPGLCAVRPASDAPYHDVLLIGENFGSTQNGSDKVMFGDSRAITNPDNWHNLSVQARVPPLGTGAVAVKLFKGAVSSNAVRFFVNDLLDNTAPLIESISPDHGAKGEYITITGRNFGANTGKVWFKYHGTEEAKLGSLDFPKECEGNLWSDTKIIVKFPENAGPLGSYSVQVARSADDVKSPIGAAFDYQTGRPGPGICKIDPMAGPVPFVAGNVMNIYGEYFNPDELAVPQTVEGFNGTNIALPYFWLVGASPDSVSNRLATAEIGEITDRKITVKPPVETQTGPVVVYRSLGDKMSNSINFTVYNCLKNNNDCSNIPDTHCCASGLESGVCKKGACAGELRSTGYMWRFSTGPFPPTPRVMEHCDAATESGDSLPSPSPDIRWSGNGNFDQYNVCRKAMVSIEFSMIMQQSTINASNMEIYKCANVSSTNFNSINSCKHVGDPIALDPGSFTLFNSLSTETENRSALALKPADSNGWEDNTWYHVILKDTVMSAPTSFTYGNQTINLDQQKLRSLRPCGAGTAYCFVFKTDERNCKLRKVIVTPSKYWTAVLEAPIKYRAIKDNADDAGQTLYWRGSGLSDQRCIVMDMKGYDWGWSTQAGQGAAALFGAPTGTNGNMTQVSALANTVAIGLTNPDDAVNVIASAWPTSTPADKKYGASPLTIDLSKPRVVDYWPKCLEACTNAEIGAQFNILMSNYNVQRGVKLLRCLDENCSATEPVADSISPSFNPADRRMLSIPFNDLNLELVTNTIYQVVLSGNGTTTADQASQLWSSGSKTDETVKAKPYQQEFTWRFRTKKEKCTVDSVSVIPALFSAVFVNDRHVYSGEARSAPDACDAKGQRLNPWSLDWAWSSQDENVAVVQTFSTKGHSPACTANCIKKGSDIPPSGAGAIEPLCGNNIVEAGEDCDPPATSLKEGKFVVSCALNCLRPGNTFPATTTAGAEWCGDGKVERDIGEECDIADDATKNGCSNICTRAGSKPATGAEEIGASICGNGMVGAGEDCDLGVPLNRVVPNSALNCSPSCTHLGTRLSLGWCTTYAGDKLDVENNMVVKNGGFSDVGFNTACAKAVSQCGDGYISPSEDACESASGQVEDFCNQFCLFDSLDRQECAPTTTIIKWVDQKRLVTQIQTEGCNSNGQHIGSSLLYSEPSVCGDEVPGKGEDPDCESGITYSHSGINPWALAIGVGEGNVGEDGSQVTNIIGTGKQGAKQETGSGKFKIVCGYKTDEECQAVMGPFYGVADNTCCYAKPLLLSTYPAAGAENVCPNTYIEAVFNKRINPATLQTNVLFARGLSTTTCPEGEENVTHLVNPSFFAFNQTASPWYKKIWTRIVAWVADLFNFKNSARADTMVYCTGLDYGRQEVINSGEAGSVEPNVTSTILFRLNNALATSSDYVILILSGVRDTRGVSVGPPAVLPLQWPFKTGNKICELSDLKITPDKYLFRAADNSTALNAVASAGSGQFIQPVNGYRWEYIWGPPQSDFVSLDVTTDTPNTVKAKNRNGEVDITATTRMTENLFSPDSPTLTGLSHITVFLCSNPWPSLETMPFHDSTYDFSTFYCMDNGGPGTADDLPYVTSSIIRDTNDDTGSTYRRRYIFTNADNKDAIGVQVFANPDHLSARDWYAARGFSGGTMSGLKIDGYEAISDGNNIYIDALNVKPPVLSTAPPGPASVYSNIYSFNINSDATQETRRVFEQLVANLKFNTGILNTPYCAGNFDLGSINYGLSCNSDLNCLAGDAPVCLNLKNKLQNNYRRLKDLRVIKEALNSYNQSQKAVNASTLDFYPLMKGNTYLPGQALSVWTDSWTELGKEAGAAALPIDPINKLAQSGTCFANQGKACFKDDDCAVKPLVNLLSYWDAEDGAKDSGPLKNNGSFVGVVGTADGKGHGKAFDFTGASDAKITAPSKEEYNDLSAGFTVTAWIYPTKKNTATIIKKGGDNNGSSLGGFVLEYSGLSWNGGQTRFNNGTIRFAVFPRAGGSIKYYAADSAAPLELNKWHFVLARFGAQPGRPGYLSIDGIRVDDGMRAFTTVPELSTDASMATNTLDIEIGQNFNGRIDSVAYYGKMLDFTSMDNVYKSLCVLHDPVTGWSTEDRRFSFACNNNSYAYRYYFDYTNPAAGFDLRAKFENDNFFGSYYPADANVASFVNKFTSEKVNFSHGICTGDEEVSSPYNTICGDGIKGAAETCDPPGSTQYEGNAPFVCHTSIDDDGNYTGKFNGQRCNSSCSGWENYQENCSTLGRCGDGKVQANLDEKCDDGALNGQNGRCNKRCSGVESTCGNYVLDNGELCDPSAGLLHDIGNRSVLDTGWCVGGNYLFIPSKPASFKSCSVNEHCPTNLCYITNDKYGLARADSCNWDCKTRGPYCGDGIVSAEWGELCETDQSCTIDGKSGKQKCTDCRQDNKNIDGLAHLWNFDSVDDETGEVLDTKGSRNGTCMFADSSQFCPEPSDGTSAGSRSYQYGKNRQTMTRVDDKDKDLLGQDFSVEFWVNPTSTSGNSLSQRLLQKGVTGSQGGFYVWWYSYGRNGKFSFSVWPKNTVPNEEVKHLSGLFNSDAWYHVALVFDGQSEDSGVVNGVLKAYINGIEVFSSPSAISNTDYPLCMGARCTDPDGDGIFTPQATYYFKGKIDEFYLYDIALSDTAIKQHYDSKGWYCSASSEAGSTGACGNNIVEESEACDRGSENGVACTSVPPRTSCSYCSADCRNVLTRDTLCGNGVIDAGEECDGINLGFTGCQAPATGQCGNDCKVRCI